MFIHYKSFYIPMVILATFWKSYWAIFHDLIQFEIQIWIIQSGLYRLLYGVGFLVLL